MLSTDRAYIYGDVCIKIDGDVHILQMRNIACKCSSVSAEYLVMLV